MKKRKLESTATGPAIPFLHHARKMFKFSYFTPSISASQHKNTSITVLAAEVAATLIGGWKVTCLMLLIIDKSECKRKLV